MMNMPAPHLQLSDESYEHFQELILSRSGLLFGPRRLDALAKCLSAAAADAGCKDLGDYYRLLQQTGTDNALWDNLISFLTMGETYFFRNKAHFDLLRTHILPELIASHGNDRRLRIWSAGCSNGEEPYSVAILLSQLLPDISSWNVLIFATDINRKSLWRARQGRYGEWSFRETDPAVRECYFTPRNGLFEITTRVRDMVSFDYLNLGECTYSSPAINTNAMDLILCRNVAIYLHGAMIQEIAERFHRCLMPGGWLIVGASETNNVTYRMFAVRNFAEATVYQKVVELPYEPARPAPGSASQWPARPSLRPEPSRRVEGPCPETAEGPSTQTAVQPPPVSEPLAPPQQPARPVDSYKEGMALLKQGRFEDAILRFRAHLESNPGFAPAYYQIACVHASAGRLDEARNWVLQALEQDSFLVEAHYILALIEQEEGVLDEAISRLKKALYLDSNFILGHFCLANLFQRVGRRDEMVRHRAQTIRLAEKLPPDGVVPCSDGLTAGRMLTMMKASM